MRILLANKFYYPRGGDCVATINTEALLRSEGHEVAVFAMQYSENQPNAYDCYFPSEVSYSGESKTDKWKALIRPLGAKEVKRKFTQLLQDFQPDIVHLNNIHTQLSPVLAQVAYEQRVKVVWTLHDYKLLCHRSDCLRDDRPCELCFVHKWPVLKYRCVKGSLAGSVLAYIEALKWNRKKLERYTNRFICPSHFHRTKMIAGGYNKKKLIVVNNFTTINTDDLDITERQNYFCYVGRISVEKGIETLIKACKQTGAHLKIAGKGPLFDELEAQYAGSNIEFLGYVDQDGVRELLGKAQAMVIPSEWYDNNPLSIIESLSLGTPVVGSRMGGIPDLIEEGKNGMLFEAWNVQELAKRLTTIMDTPGLFDYRQIAFDADLRFSPGRYYRQLMEIYTNI